MIDFVVAMARHFAAAYVGFASGAVVSGAVFAFITAVGMVPRFAQKTGTRSYCRVYETAITFGGVLGTVVGFVPFKLPQGGAFITALAGVFTAAFALCVGIFFGALAMSLAEVLDVMPILSRRGRTQRGIFFFVLAIALGKMIGALLYFLVTGFHDAGEM